LPVFTRLDRAKIEDLRRRDELLWLDLCAPSDQEVRPSRSRACPGSPPTRATTSGTSTTAYSASRIESYRDVLTSAMDVYLSTRSNRLNVVMQRLTPIATIFLPLTFVTGFFGQNFGWLVDHITGFGSFGLLGIGGLAAAGGAARGDVQARGGPALAAGR
jgi:hypothetical protein